MSYLRDGPLALADVVSPGSEVRAVDRHGLLLAGRAAENLVIILRGVRVLRVVPSQQGGQVNHFLRRCADARLLHATHTRLGKLLL